MVKHVFRSLLVHMREVAKGRGVSTVDLAPSDFAGVLNKKYIFNISDDVLQTAVARAQAMQKVSGVASSLTGPGRGQKRRLSEIREFA